MLMKDKFQSKAVPRGTRTIWRYLGALFILFTFAIGNVWAADPVENVGTYSTQVISADGTTSTWTFITPGSQVTIPTSPAETEDNDIIFHPGGGSKMKFSSSNGLSWSGNSDGYIYVPAGAAGSISMTVKGASDSRWLQLYVDGVDQGSTKRLWSKEANPATAARGPRTFTFTSSDLTTKGEKTYLHLKDNNTEMKIATFTVTLTTGTYLTPSCSTEITTQPSGATLAIGDANPELSIVATNVASYAWKESSNGTSYDGASTLGSSASFTPSVNDAVQTKYYYCEVTSSCDGAAVVKSNIVTINVVGAITYYTVTLNPAGGTIVDATGWTLNAGNYEKEVAEGTVLTLPTFTKTDRAFKTWRKAGPADVASPVTVDGDLSLTAIWTATIEQVIYSWEGAEGGAIETGGTASSSGSNNFINIEKGGYYCFQISGGTSYDKYVEITLSGEEKVKTGDKIKYWGFYHKSSTANARPKMRDGNSPNAEIFNDGTNLPNLYDGTGKPAERTFTVPASINTNKVQITRSQTGSNTWIPKLQIIREVQVEEGDLLTVTFDANGGSAIAPVVVASGQTVAKPTDPTWAHHRFNEWQLAGSAYDFSSAVTTDITLVANWTQLYTISFAAGDGSGDAPAAIADKAKDETFEVPANTFTAPEGKEFDKWNDGSADYAPGATYTVGTANVVLTAQWKAVTAKYTVIFKDGETTLDTKLFEVGSNPSDADIDKTKPLFAFAAWQKDAADIALDDEFWATVVKDASVTLTARWTKAYASTYDMEAYAASEGASKAGLEAALTAANYAFTNINGIDNEHTHNYTYDGMKYKTTDGDLSFNVLGGKVVEVKTGHLPTNDAVTMYINGVADATVFEGANEDVETHKTNYFYSAAEALYRLEVLASKGTCSVKKVTIRDPFTVTFNANGGDPVAPQDGLPSVTLPLPIKGTESFIGWFDGETKVGEAGESYTPTANITLHAQWEAVSTDARLASITFSSAAGTLEPAFDPEVTNYTYTMPYGTAAVPTITGATAVNANAKAPVIDAQAANWGDVAHIHGVAQSDDTKDYYITMKIAPKDGVCLVWADVPADNTLTYNATNSKFYAESDVTLQNSNVKGKDGSAPSGKKFQSNGFLKIALNEGTFLEGDVVVLDVTYGTANVMHVFKAQAATSADVIGEAAGNTDAGLNKVAITEDASTLWLVRGGEFGDWNPHVDYVAVYRAMNPLLKAITIDGREGVIDALDDHHFNVLIPFEAELDALTIATTIVWNAPHATTPEVVISNEGAWIIGDNTYRVMDKDGDYTDYTITLTRDVKKYTVTYYDGLTVLGTEDVEDGNHPTAAGITVPVKFGSTFEGWSETDGGAVVELSDITISAVKDLFAKYEVIPCPTSGTVYKFEIKDGLASEALPEITDKDMSSYINATGAGLLTYTATANNKAEVKTDGTIQLKDATAAYLKLELACALAAGDQIRAHVSNNPIRVQVSTTYDSDKDLILAKDNYVFVDITSAMEGKKVLYIARSSNGNANLADFEIYRRPELTGASMADFTLGVGQSRTPNLILEPSADAIVNSEVWEIVGEPTNLTGAAIDPVTGEITTGTLVDESIDGSITVKVTLNGTIKPTCIVTVVKAYPQANVEESMLWDWSASCWAGKANTEMTGEDIDHDLLMANTGVNIVNSDDFRSDMLIVNGKYAWRTEGSGKEYFQGNSIKFTTTVAGAARVYFRSTGSGKTVEVSINGTVAGSRTNTFGWSDYVVVPAGEVAIVGTGDGYTRIQKIEFLGAIDSRTGYAARELGTVCYEDDAVIFGAKTYELSGTNEHGYAVFDEIPSGEIEAGNPYLFESNGGEVLICKKPGANHADNEIAVNGMIGSFLGTTLIPGTGNYYYFSGRNIWRVNDFTVNIPVPAHRCYVDYDVLSTSPAPLAPAPGRRRVVLGVNGENQAQGFENIENGDAPMKVMIDGTLYILRGEKVFDATGRLVK